VLHPTVARQHLRVLELVPGHHGTGVIEDHEPGARGALIDGADEIRHLSPPLFALIPTSQDKRLFTGVSRIAARLTTYIP
jgi:hypothetical protein